MKDARELKLSSDNLKRSEKTGSLRKISKISLRELMRALKSKRGFLIIRLQ